ncbi:MAG TPA: M15 family metallopeptidase [Dokdonella sp.]|nr:M15 family metallopeptidase [Dokdonella sp.]
MAVLVAAFFTGEALAGAPRLSAAKTAAEADLVDIRVLVPDIAIDLRYAGTNNFVGRPIDGYAAARCLLRPVAARALAKAERALRKQHLRLKLFDCYRPARAVRQFVEWARDLEDQQTKSRYYPNIDKRALLGAYIAPVSGHSRGATVDLTLQQCKDDSHCSPLDMGTAFDFFDPRANTDSAGITPAQRRNRQRLRRAMEQAGFRNYAMEWWHYGYQPEPDPELIHDVPIR